MTEIGSAGGHRGPPSADDAEAMKLHAVNLAFATKAVDAAAEINDGGKMFDDPLGLFTAKDGGDKSGDDKAEGRRFVKKKAKKNAENIFADFGKNHESRLFHEVDIGGVTIQRFSVKRFWQNDRDVRRWQDNLGDNSRYKKLLFDVRAKYHEDINADVAELNLQHSHFRRQRSGLEAEKAARRNAAPIAMQLRELQRQIRPKEKKQKKIQKGMFGSLGFFGDRRPEEKIEEHEEEREEKASSKDGEPSNTVSENEALIYKFLEFIVSYYGSLEDAFHKLDINKNGQMSYQELQLQLKHAGYKTMYNLQNVWSIINRSNHLITLKEWMNLKPYLLQGMVSNKIRAAAPQSASSRPQASTASTPVPRDLESEDGGDLLDDRRTTLGQLQVPPGVHVDGDADSLGQGSGGQGPALPRTLSLLLFRNGDLWHSGETVFIRKRPTSVAELLHACGEQCSPFILPVVALLDTNLQPVRYIEELNPHSAYLVKGQESLDPPPMFFSTSKSEGPSLRKLNAVRESGRAEGEHRLLSNPSRNTRSLPETKFSTFKASLMSSMPSDRPGGPSSASSRYNPPRPGPKWQPHTRLSATLSWSGLGQLPSHHDYSTWAPVNLSSYQRQPDSLALTM